jgi:UDP-N-acetylmuramoylalanine--D-glutamate ligase
MDKQGLIDRLNGKKILIWGYGREGKSTEAFLKAHCPAAVTEVFEGKPEEMTAEVFDAYDAIVKSPGIPYFSGDPKLTGQTELFLQAFSGQTIGITGTKGKSTTSSMMAHVLAECSGRPVLLVGNIGIPCLDAFDEITEDTIVVYEMSCHQLANAHTAPHIAVFLNLYEEHLDYYHTLDAYFGAKAHIASCQKAGDRFYKGENVPEIETESDTFVIKPSPAMYVPGFKLFGAHNHLNALFVRTIAQDCFGCDPSAVTASLQTFRQLPHRMEPVGEFAGRSWYDDSISTIPEAAIQALESIPGVRAILIGGMDRGIDYGILEDYMRAHPDREFICMYATGNRICKELCALPENVHQVGNLDEAVAEALRVTKPGDGIVLSPAAASYGYFKNFEERGDVFKGLVKGLR